MPRHFSNWLRAYAEHTRISEAPRQFHFWTGVGTIAGALRRQVWIDQRHFQWSPNFYIILVGPPGLSTKSTAMNIGMNLLAEVPGVHMGPQSMTWQGLGAALQESTSWVPVEDAKELKESTPGITMSCITCAVTELGTFLRPDDLKMMDVLTDLWDGRVENRPWLHKLMTSEGLNIHNPWINIVACTTPAWIRKNVPETMVGGGLMSRIIFVYGEEKDQLIPYPAKLIPKKDHKEREEKLIADLCEIGLAKGKFVLTKEAEEFGEAWYIQHNTVRPEHLASERYDGYIGRKQTHLHKLAMILAAAESNELLITDTHLKLARDMLTGIESDMLKVFESIGMAETNIQMEYLIEFVRVYKRIEQRPLWRLCMRNMSRQEFLEAVNAALAAEVIRGVQAPDGIWYSYRSDK